MTARKRRGVNYENAYVQEGTARRYRVCYVPGSQPRVLMVALKCAAGGERFLDIDGRRARQIIAKADIKPAAR